MGLQSDILGQPVGELELRPLVTATATTTARDAVRLMRENDVGCVIVVDDAGKPQAKFTEKRLIHLLQDAPAGLEATIERFLVDLGGTVTLDDPVARVIELIENQRSRFVCVTDQSGKAVAIVGQKSIMEYLTEHFPREVKVQAMESKLHMDQREGA